MRPYTETREASGELLRIVLPMLSRHPAGFTPVSYALWYEYAAGVNTALRAELDKVVEGGGMLDEERAWALYEKYISRRDDSSSMRLRSELERMLQGLAQTAANTGDHASEFGASLDGFGRLLAPGADPETIKKAVHAMLEKTEQMSLRTRALETQLRESSREADLLRSELIRAKDEALTDPLTGITNRRGFMSAIELAQASQGLAGTCLIAVDIDHFKKCNDTYGHLFGDKVIRNLATVLKRMVKGQDVAARMGGEEFLVFLPDTPVEGAYKLAENIRTTIAAGRITNPVNGDTGRITISLGVTDYRPDEAVDDYIHRADQALYASKTGGRDRVTVAPSGAAQGTQALAGVPLDLGATGRMNKATGAAALRH
jgi:diguanylate cyclase